MSDVKDKANTKTVVCHFRFKNATPGALRYEQVNEKGEVYSIANGALIGTLYLRKSAMGSSEPKTLTVPVTFEA